MIPHNLEGIVSTLNEDQRANIYPRGPIVEDAVREAVEFAKVVEKPRMHVEVIPEDERNFTVHVAALMTWITPSWVRPGQSWNWHRTHTSPTPGTAGRGAGGCTEYAGGVNARSTWTSPRM
jgi:hypothetical protein